MRLQKSYHSHSGIVRGRFNPALLPDPHSVLHRLGIHYGKTNSYGFWRLHCPFHNNLKEAKATLRLHHVEGHYFCHACGAEGKNILGFYMRATGKSFLEASTILGAWENCL